MKGNVIEQFGIGFFYSEVYRAVVQLDPIWVAIFVLSVVVVIRRRKEADNIYSFFFPNTYIYIGLTFFFPYTYVMMVHILNRFAFARMHWLFLTVPLVSCAVILATDRMNVKRKVILFLMIFIICFIHGSGTQILLQQNGDVDNLYYKVPQDVVDVGNFLWEDNKEYFTADKDNHICVALIADEEPGDDFDYATEGAWSYEKMMRIGLRSYISPVEIFETGGKLESIDTSVHDYVICAGSDALREQIEKMGYERVYDSQRYTMLKRIT